MTFYLDSQRTITRRESSLITPKRYGTSLDSVSMRGPFSTPGNESTISIAFRPKGSIQKEIVTMMFESMLECIVESWTVIETKHEELLERDSEQTITSIKKKKVAQSKMSKNRRSRSAALLANTEIVQIDPMQMLWWSAPDEKAVIRFKNGNMYEGNISMKCMHGGGRFQWADGTVYLGSFTNNEINGHGMIQWKDDTWYQGEFAANLRHGKGLYVDSRRQRSYGGDWHCGTKHGKGAIYYDKTFKNSYDGEWVHNERTGYGSREYSESSGYKGEWERDIREGKGMIIWPNHDFYRGEWKNGVMSGNGIYIWGAYFNNSMSSPSLSVYQGQWEKGKRHGYGFLDIGLGWGSFYKGEFDHNKKHGAGKFVTNNGQMVQGQSLFVDDNLKPVTESTGHSVKPKSAEFLTEPFYKFDICDSTVGLHYHINKAIENIDKQAEIRNNIIDGYMINNSKVNEGTYQYFGDYEEQEKPLGYEGFEDFIEFELDSLHNSLKCYERDLTNIYYKYATICNMEEIHFRPILLRLYLWQLYYDCHVHEKGLTLVEIDRLYYKNPEWLSKSPHNAFEKIYFWQFLHSLISVAIKLYAKKELPGMKPDTILANSFRMFMENDILPGSNEHRGRLVSGYGAFVPLTAAYALYRSLGEPHTIRAFLCAVRHPPHYEQIQPDLVEASDECVPLGRNAYVFGDEMVFVVDNNEIPENLYENTCHNLKLFNFVNLSTKTIIHIFAEIFPAVCNCNKIMDVNIPLTFLEFFEALIACAERSIEVKREELKWREKLESREAILPLHSHHVSKITK